MPLNPAVLGARRPVQRVVWEREDQTIISLTGLVLSGTIENKTTGVARDIDGTLEQVPGIPDAFYWTWGELDVGTVGRFRVRFRATDPDDSSIYEESYWMDWAVNS